MPSHTVASALIKLYFLDGAPWNWSAWQQRTGISHGLFPEDDSHLPPGLSRKNVTDVWSYFVQYNELPTEDAKIQFATKTRGNKAFPGRGIWNSWVAKNWSRWGIHALIISELKENDIHPQDILIRENKPDLAWPSADGFVALILDSVGMQLFGDEAFPSGCEVLRTDHRLCVRIFVQRSWSSIRTRVKALTTRAKSIEALANAAFEELREGKVTKGKVNQTIRAVAKWKECAELLCTEDNVKKADAMLAELQAVMRSLGAKIPQKKPVADKRISKVATQALQELASKEDVSDLLYVYHEYFEANSEDPDEEPPHACPSPEQNIDDENGKFGMEVEAGLSALQLSQRLGFYSRPDNGHSHVGLPPSFNHYRHRSGISPWDDEAAFEFEPHEIMPLHLDYLRLHWHQLAGVHSIMRSLFTKTKDDGRRPGVLIGDEVGLGKTAQAITSIAFLNKVIYQQAQGLRPPPIVADRPFFMGKERVPSLPHLILCPGTLVAQWVSELRILFLPRSVDILVYDNQSDEQAFWGPSGPLRSASLHDPHNCIIIASHSVVTNDFKKSHDRVKRGKNSRPWLIPKAKRTLENTIFGQLFLTVIIDEAHHMRNPGYKHLATLRLLENAVARLVMTATPLHTAPKDIASMARLTGIPHFYEEISHEEEKNDLSRLQRAKKLEDDGEASRAENVLVVRRLQQHCRGHFLRRTTLSVSNEGQPLISLPPYREIIGLVQLTDRELEIMKERSEDAKAAISTSSSARIHTRKFYLEYRLAVGYAKESVADIWPTFKSLDEWAPLRSTKMDICARICRHYLTHDAVEDVAFEDGQAFFPEIRAPKTLSRTRRIIIYAEFPSMAPLLRNVLHLYGIETLAINGKTPFQQRDKQVEDLYNDNHPARVLIFSSVGSAGLNLAIADVVIFFDQPWLAQDVRQIRGRAHRQPQDKEVKLIHLLAIDSSDPVLFEMANGKQNMFDAFVNKELGEELRSILAGNIPDVDDAPPEDPEKILQPEATKPKKAKRRAKKLVTDDDDEDAAPPQGTAGQGEQPTSDRGQLSDSSGSASPYPDCDSDVDAVNEILRRMPVQQPHADNDKDMGWSGTERSKDKACDSQDKMQVDQDSDPIDYEDDSAPAPEQTLDQHPAAQASHQAQSHNHQWVGFVDSRNSTPMNTVRDGHVPVTKRARHGTIGPEGRAAIQAQEQNAGWAPATHGQAPHLEQPAFVSSIRRNDEPRATPSGQVSALQRARATDRFQEPASQHDFDRNVARPPPKANPFARKQPTTAMPPQLPLPSHQATHPTTSVPSALPKMPLHTPPVPSSNMLTNPGSSVQAAAQSMRRVIEQVNNRQVTQIPSSNALKGQRTKKKDK